jgi:hypothetical protein
LFNEKKLDTKNLVTLFLLRERKRKYCRVRKFIIGQHLGAHKRKYSAVRKSIIGQYWDDTRGSTVQ